MFSVVLWLIFLLTESSIKFIHHNTNFIVTNLAYFEFLLWCRLLTTEIMRAMKLFLYLNHSSLRRVGEMEVKRRFLNVGRKWRRMVNLTPGDISSGTRWMHRRDGLDTGGEEKKFPTAILRRVKQESSIP